ncbi:hypothetical protein SDC9_115459 [bioreactor metagenome]|uniref:Copper amine oxidase-like N-terminal domain-containing protein n=1 Tax=bioreactor metagenome TaxID=1076179 RepID=A0A645BT27_9ZZZZ|nr:copper amine oxidase N-terminal domain-containing protein [Candidatus Metalachnospira sp.]
MRIKVKIAMLISAVVISGALPVNAFAADVLIDSRNAEADNIVLTEAEEGMFEQGSKIILALEKIELEDDISYKVTKGDIEIEAEVTDKDGLGKLADISADDLKKYPDDCSYIVITVIDESTEASTIEISGLKLYLDRTLPNGGYSLMSVYSGNGIWGNSSSDKSEYDKSGIFKYEPITVDGNYVDVVTAGRDEDDSTVNKKITLTVGESKLSAGENAVLLDAPAYINSEGYAMLPVRAIAEALDATVNWNEETKTVSILRGQRIVSMEVGSNEMYINGTKVPMNSKASINDERIFVPVRDVANALSISSIDWNAETKTITLN